MSAERRSQRVSSPSVDRTLARNLRRRGREQGMREQKGGQRSQSVVCPAQRRCCQLFPRREPRGLIVPTTVLLLLLGAVSASANAPEPEAAVLQAAARIARVWRNAARVSGGGGTEWLPIAGRLEARLLSPVQPQLDAARKCACAPIVPGLVFRSVDRAPDAGQGTETLIDLLAAELGEIRCPEGWLVCHEATRAGVFVRPITLGRGVERGGRRVITLRSQNGVPAGLAVVVTGAGVPIALALFTGNGDGRFGVAYGRETLSVACASAMPCPIDARAIEGSLLAVEGTAAAAWGDGAATALPCVLRALARLPEDHPWFEDLAGDLAQCLLATMPPDRALSGFETLRGKGLDRPRVALLHAGLLARVGRFAEAERLLRGLLACTPIEWEARLALMRTVLMKPELASEVPLGILPLPSSRCAPRVAGDLGTSLVLVGEMDSARALLEHVLSTPYATAAHLWAIAQVHYAGGRLDAAREALEACVASPDVHAAWYGDLGAVLCEIGEDWQEAERAFDTAIRELGPSRDYLVGRAWARGMQDDRVGSSADLEACLREHPRTVEAWRLLGELAVRFGSRDNLMRALEALRDLDPTAAQQLMSLSEREGVLSPQK